jgi:hypothetical protein
LSTGWAALAAIAELEVLVGAIAELEVSRWSVAIAAGP